MKYPFQQLSRTNRPYLEELKQAAAEVIESGWYLLGPRTEAFESELARIVGTRLAVGTSCGLEALRLIMRAYMELGRLSPGDEIIAAANTFIATLLPASDLGLKIRLVEPREDTFSLDWQQAERAVTDRTRMVAVTHLYGNPSWDEEVAARLRDRGIIIIEDNAQGVGAQWHGRMTGSLGDASAISFYPAKNIGALGDAGAVCSDDEELMRVVKSLGNYGADRKYHYQYRGYNSRIDEIQAAMLSIKLRHLEEITRGREEAARVYCDTISHPDIRTPQRLDNCRQVWHQYVLRTPRRDELADYLASRGVQTLIHYPVPPHLQPCYAELRPAQLPVTERLADEVLSIPIADITPEEAHEIAGIINLFPAKL